ncbi:MAG: helix-turn-helix domain-containing protein [Gallionella sp.]|jgi:excisionase family DNA binding protein|nr:helix-turn-helix domain-containing protein [Gallionella sp.]
MTISPSRVSKPSEVAKSLGLSPSTVARYARENRIPSAMTPGGHRRFDLDEVRAALDGTPRVHLVALSAGTGSTHIGKGPSLSMSPPHAIEQRLRGIETVPPTFSENAELDQDSPRPSSAISELVYHARRILVASGR